MSRKPNHETAEKTNNGGAGAGAGVTRTTTSATATHLHRIYYEAASHNSFNTAINRIIKTTNDLNLKQLKSIVNEYNNSAAKMLVQSSQALELISTFIKAINHTYTSRGDAYQQKLKKAQAIHSYLAGVLELNISTPRPLPTALPKIDSDSPDNDSVSCYLADAELPNDSASDSDSNSSIEVSVRNTM